MRKMTGVNLLLIFLLGVILFSSCAPNPRRELTERQKVADIEWILTKIEAHYAPLDYKQDMHGFSYEELRTEFLERAVETKNNEEFYVLIQELVARFQDAHMSARVEPAELPGRSKVAYLGFRGQRVGDGFEVTSFIPSFNAGAGFPIKVGDIITKLDGVELKKAVDEQILPYRNLGNEQSNYTAFMGALFLRSSLSLPIPSEFDDAVLTVRRKEGSIYKTYDFKVPWEVLDYVEFSQRQQAAARRNADIAGIDFDAKREKVLGLMTIARTNPYVTESFVRSLVESSHSLEDFEQNLSLIREVGRIRTFEYQARDLFSNIFDLYEVVSHRIEQTRTAALAENNTESSKEEKKEEEKKEEEEVTPADSQKHLAELKKTRFVPEKNVVAITEAKIFPAYVHIVEERQKKENNVEVISRYAIAYLQIPTFSLGVLPESVVLEEVEKTMNRIRNFNSAAYGVRGVDGIVLDLINNGGGSLSLGLKLADIIADQRVEMPNLEVILNDSWVDPFERASINANVGRAIARRTFRELEAAEARGDRLSPVISTEALYPFSFNNRPIAPNDKNKSEPTPIFILANEMCASMCDIFTAMLQENGIAKVIGQKTMGAGGNVVTHYAAPHSNVEVSLTESLILTAGGRYLENDGVDPDIKVETFNYTGTKYKGVIERAYKEVLTLAKAKRKSVEGEADTPNLITPNSPFGWIFFSR